jgi:hypothetical protein
MVLQQGCDMTYALKNSKQVTTLGSEEKCAITVLVTLTKRCTVTLPNHPQRFHITIVTLKELP